MKQLTKIEKLAKTYKDIHLAFLENLENNIKDFNK
jgi:hypothetical protein